MESKIFTTSKKNKVKLLKPIGEGGYGQVFLGKYYSKDSQSYVAVKRVTIKEDQQGFLDERHGQMIKIQQKVLDAFEKKRNPHLLYAIDFGSINTNINYFVLPLYEWDLHKFLKINSDNLDKGLIPFIFKSEKDNKYHIKEQYLLEIISQLIQSLIAFQSSDKLSHRDIKPSNFLVKRFQGKILVGLSDFGGAKNIKQGSKTTISAAFGTRRYQPPQIFQKFDKKKIVRLDPRKFDSWALGVTIAELLMQQSFLKNPERNFNFQSSEQKEQHVEKIKNGIQNYEAFVNQMQEYGYSKPFRQSIKNFLSMMLERNEGQRMLISKFKDGQKSFKKSFQFLTNKLPKFESQISVNLTQFFNQESAKQKFSSDLFEISKNEESDFKSEKLIEQSRQQRNESIPVSQQIVSISGERRKVNRVIIHKDDKISIDEYIKLIEFLA